MGRELRREHRGRERRRRGLIVDPLDIGQKDRRAWSYLPGQRRVKVAPVFSHDTPNPATAGATTFDDTFIFNGSMDRFDFKLIGKKEMRAVRMQEALAASRRKF